MATLNYAVVFNAAHGAGHAAWRREPKEPQENCPSFLIHPVTCALAIAARRYLDAQPTGNGDGVRVHNLHDMPFTRTRAYLDVFIAVCKTADPAARITIETE